VQKKIISDPLLLVLLLASLGLNVFLGIRLYRPTELAAGAPPRPRLAEGAVVPVIKGTTLDGQPYTVSYGGDRRPTVLYVFSETCKWCDQNAGNLATLVRERQKQFRFIGLSLSPLQPGNGKPDMDGLLVLGDIDVAAMRAYGIGGTPHTIVVSPEGKVLKQWMGAYAATVERDVEQFFAVELPGLGG
jgi:AhpC/TSA family